MIEEWKASKRDRVQNVWKKMAENLDFAKYFKPIWANTEAAARVWYGENLQENTRCGILLQ